jgi:hypothetical protein
MYGVTNRVTEVTKPVTHERKFDVEVRSQRSEPTQTPLFETLARPMLRKAA